MTYLWNILISLINTVRQQTVEVGEPGPKYPLKDRHVRSQRRAAYRLRQYPTRSENQF